MKLIIDIDEETYKKCKWKNNGVVGLEWWERAIANGTPILDNATNGDVIKAMFDVIEEHFYDEDRMVDVYGLDRTDDPSTFYADWWNALYKAENKEQTE